MVIHLNGSMDPDLVTKAVLLATRAEPVTCCHLLRDHDALWWEPVPGITAADLVIRLSSGQPDSLLYEALSYPIDPYYGPLVRVVHIINETQSGDILVINAHHAAMDGRGLKDFSGLLMAGYSSLVTGKLFEIVPTSMDQRRLPQVSTLAPDYHQVRQSDVSAGWLSPVSVPVCSLAAERDQYSLLTFPGERTRIIHALRKEWGVTMNDLMIAVIARVCSSVIPHEPDLVVPLFTTIDLRRYLPVIPPRSVLNYSTAFEVRIPVREEESLKDTAVTVHRLMNRIKAGSPGLDGVIEAEQLYERGYAAAKEEMDRCWQQIRNFGAKTTLFSNTGIISVEQMDTGEPGISSAYLLPTHSLPPGFFFALSTYGDQMTISATYYTPAYDPALIQRIFTLMDQVLPGYASSPGTCRVL